MESENKAGKRKNKRKSRKALIIGIIICAVLVAAGGLLLLIGPIDLMRAKAESKTCYSYPADNHFGLTKIYVGGDFISVVVNAAKVDKYSDAFSDYLGIHKPEEHFFLEGYTYVNHKAVYPDTLSVFRCGSSYIVTSRFKSSSENIVLATSWNFGCYTIGPFSAPTLEYGEYGGEWSHTYEQVFLPDQGVFSPLEEEERVYEFGPEEYTEEIGSEEADTGTEISTEETDDGVDAGTENSSEETDEDVDGQLTDEQAVESIKQFCYAKNPDLESIVDEGQYEVYWTVISSSEDEIVVMFRSYTAAQLYYYIDRNTGDTYETEFVPGITTEEERTGEEFNIKEYASDIAF